MKSTEKCDIEEWLLTSSTGSMKRVVDRILRLCTSKKSPVLIVGESGVGKEYVAQLLLNDCKTSEMSNFTAINCGAFAKSEMLISELFGHKKGAYTGAINERLGILRSSPKSLFLDEIDKSSPKFQYTLLRFLRNKEIKPLGSDKVERLDTVPRIVLATSIGLDKIFHNRDARLESLGWATEETRNKKVADESETNFPMIVRAESPIRQDFLNRISNFVIEMPPLRDRVNDLAIIVNYIVERFAKETGNPIKYVDGWLIDFIINYPWPDNFPELEGFLRNGMLYQKKGKMQLKDCLENFGSKGMTNAIQVWWESERRILGKYVGAYLGYTFRPNEIANVGFVPISEVLFPRNSFKFKVKNLPRVFENLQFLNRIEDQKRDTNCDFDFERIDNYCALRNKFSTQKEIYPKLGFIRSGTFRNWLRNNHFDQ